MGTNIEGAKYKLLTHTLARLRMEKEKAGNNNTAVHALK